MAKSYLCRACTHKTLFSLLLLFFIVLKTGAQHPALNPEASSRISNQQPVLSEKEIDAILDSAVIIGKTQPDTAMLLFRKGLNAAIASKYVLAATDAFSHIITIYNNKGHYEDALRETVRMEAIVKSAKLYDVLPAIYNSRANRYQRKGMYDSAMNYYYAAIEQAEKSKTINPATLPTLYTNLSGVLEAIGDYEKGLLYLGKAEKIVRETKHTHLLSLVLINKGNAFSNAGNTDSSISNLKEALVIAKKYNYLQWQHLALSNLASVYYERNYYKEALNYLEQAVRLKGDVDPNYQNTNVAMLGKVYFATGNYKLAQDYLLQALHTAERLNIARDILKSHNILSQLYARQGDHKKAYEHHLTYTQLEDSLESKETKQNISQLEIKFRTAQKDKEIIAKELQISRQKTQLKQRNLWIVGISAGALLLGALAALLYSLYRSNWHQKRFQEEKFRNLEQEQKIGQLRAMMKGEEKERIRIAQNLHDGIGGMLASIKMNLNAISEERSDLHAMPGFAKVSGMLSDTASEVRKTAHNLMPDTLTKHDLRKALLLYSENNSNTQLLIDLQYDVQELLNKDAELLIYRIIQELIQNIIKHSGANHAVIQLMLHQDNLSIMVEDNGKGFDTLAPVNGAGLDNIKKRVEALQGYLSVSSTPDRGTTVHIEFEFEKLKMVEQQL